MRKCPAYPAAAEPGLAGTAHGTGARRANRFALSHKDHRRRAAGRCDISREQCIAAALIACASESGPEAARTADPGLRLKLLLLACCYRAMAKWRSTTAWTDSIRTA